MISTRYSVNTHESGGSTMIKPRYKLPVGIEVTSRGRTRHLRRAENDSYEAIDCDTGEIELLSYLQAVDYLGQPDASAPHLMKSASTALARVKAGGLNHRDQLNDAQRDELDFRKALCLAVDALEATGIAPRIVSLDKAKNRRFICDFAGRIYTSAPIKITHVRGGKLKKIAVMPRGRTLLKYVKRFREAERDEMALVDQDWLKGNRIRRVSSRVLELMTRAVDECFLDTRQPSVSSALRRLEQLLEDENLVRQARGQPPLKAVSHKTMKTHIEQISSTARDLARMGSKHVANNRSRGSTDTRALMMGEVAEVDECKISLIATVKEKGLWERLSADEKSTLEEIDEIIHTRLWLVVVLDIATRMPLGWALTDKPSSEATLEALRMATRDKTREKILYGCERDPMPACGLAQIRADNGTGVRNSAVKSAVLGLNTHTVDMRSYHGVDKPHLERLFWSIESILFNLIHGYTGRKAGALPGYDPIKNGVLNCQEIYGLITRFFIDEYPFQRHYGATMMGARPIKMAERVNNKYGMIHCAPPLDRRVSLGWQTWATVTDDGVNAYNLPYTSPEIQELRDKIKGKVSVYSDPDCVDEVTILIPGSGERVLGRLTWTAMKGLTIAEALEFSASLIRESPEETLDFNSQRVRASRKRFDQMRHIAIENKLPRSFMTRKEAEAKARVIAAGVHAPVERVVGTAQPGTLGRSGPVDGARAVGDGFKPAARTSTSVEPELDKPDTKGKLT